MTAVASSPGEGAFKSLWRRAPVWRFCLLSAALLTLLFGLFPPGPRQEERLPAAPLSVNQATYSHPQRVARDTSPPTAQSQGAIEPVRTNEPSPQATNASPPTPVSPLLRQPVTQPTSASAKAAELSLAPPGNVGAKQDGPSAGDGLRDRIYSESIVVSGFKLPLPPGKWAMLANSSLAIPNSSGMSYFLGRIERNRLTGAVVVYALKSTLKPGTGFEAFKGCNDPNAIFVANEGVAAFDHQACWLIHTYFTPPWQQWGDRAVKMANLTRSAAGDMSAKGVSYPQDFLAIQFFRAEKWGMIDASYLFSPESEGVKSNAASSFREADWFPPNIQRYPEKVAYAGRLKDWGASFWRRFKDAFSEGE
jgi:hypothetical protein